MWTTLPHFFYINLLIPRVLYVLFINPLRNRVTHVQILWCLGYHVSATRLLYLSNVNLLLPRVLHVFCIIIINNFILAS